MEAKRAARLKRVNCIMIVERVRVWFELEKLSGV